MKKIYQLAGAFFVLCPILSPATSIYDVTIDSFLAAQSAPGSVDTRSTADGSDIIGGERDIISFLSLSANGTVPGQLRIAYPDGSPMTGRAGTDVTYDGDDNNPSASSFAGLGSVDLTQGGLNDRFRLLVTSVSSTSATLTIDVNQIGRSSTIQLNLPQTPGIWDIPFASFVRSPLVIFSSGVDFHAVGYINFHFEMNQGESVTIDNIAAVPEPSTISLMFLLGLGLVSRNIFRPAGLKKL
jgi:PEP-CTERM motif